MSNFCIDGRLRSKRVRLHEEAAELGSEVAYKVDRGDALEEEINGLIVKKRRLEREIAKLSSQKDNLEGRELQYSS